MIQILNQRIKELLSKKRISKAEVSEKLGIGYSTLWRRLNGERGINIDFLMELASILETTVSYLLGETNDPTNKNNIIQNTNDNNNDIHSNNSKEKSHNETTGHLIFKHKDYYVDVPDTPSNQIWFRELTQNMLKANPN